MFDEVLRNQSQPALLPQSGIGVCMHGAWGLGLAVTPQPVATSYLIGD